MRLARDWNFDGFVEATGLSRGHVSEIERGMCVPNLNSLAKIAEALEVTLADIVLGESLREQLFDACAALPDLDLKQLLREAERRAANHVKR